jgi:hypothetical protein
VVTAKTQYDLQNAEQYFEEHLCVGDYYNHGERVSGEWIGLPRRETEADAGDFDAKLQYRIERFTLLKK